MMGRKEKPLGTVKGATTLVAKTTTVTGSIHFSGNLDIEGTIKGSVIAEPDKPAILRVVQGGMIEGEVRVPQAVVDGRVKGDIHCTERLELAENAEIDGDVYYNLIEMMVGCKVNGALKHVSPLSDDLAAKREQRAASSETNS